MAKKSERNQSSKRSNVREYIDLYRFNKDSSILRSKKLELDVSQTKADELPTRKKVAEMVGANVEKVVVGRFGDACGSRAYAVVNECPDSRVTPVFLAAEFKEPPVLVPVNLHAASAEDVARLVGRSRQVDPKSQLRLLLKGGNVEAGASLANCGVEALDVLQWVEVKEKVMNVIHYQKPDVRRKFHPRVQNTSSIREIKDILMEELAESNLQMDWERDELLLSVRRRLLESDDLRPHINVIDTNGHLVSRKMEDKYYTLHIFPKETARVHVLMTYRRDCDRNTKKRKTVVILPADSSVETLIEHAARFVSPKLGYSIKLCNQDEEVLPMSRQDKVSSLPNRIKDTFYLVYAEPEPDMRVYVDVVSYPSGQRTCVFTHCRSSDTVSNLQKSVAEKLDTSPDLLSLQYESQAMEQDKFILDYKLRDRCRIDCAFHISGKVVYFESENGMLYKYLIKDKSTMTMEDLEAYLITSWGPGVISIRIHREWSSQTVTKQLHRKSGPNGDQLDKPESRSLHMPSRSETFSRSERGQPGCDCDHAHSPHTPKPIHDDRLYLLESYARIRNISSPCVKAGQTVSPVHEKTYEADDETKCLGKSEEISPCPARERVPRTQAFSRSEEPTLICCESMNSPSRFGDARKNLSPKDPTLRDGFMQNPESRIPVETPGVVLNQTLDHSNGHQIDEDWVLSSTTSVKSSHEMTDVARMQTLSCIAPASVFSSDNVDSAFESTSTLRKVNTKEGLSIEERQTKSVSYSRNPTNQRSSEEELSPKRQCQCELQDALPQLEYSASSYDADTASPSSVTDETLSTVAKELGEEWFQVCIDLGVNCQHLIEIKDRSQGNFFQRALEGLRKWKKKKGRQATVAALRQVLEKNELCDIAEKLPSRSRQASVCSNDSAVQ